MMKSALVLTVLLLNLFAHPSTGTACPSGPDREEAEAGILSGLISGRTKSDVVDYVSFLQPSDNSNSCFVLVSITEKLSDKIEPVNKTELYSFFDQRYQRVDSHNKSLKQANPVQDARNHFRLL
jgi:hypothetical protein